MKMTPIIQRLFVNRDRELDAFRQMIRGDSEKRIMTLRAPGGMGKSWLMARLQHECSCQGMCICEVDFRSSRVYDYLAILRHTRDDYGAMHFNAFTVLVNRYTQPVASVRIGGGDTSVPTEIAVEDVEESEVRVAGRDNIVVRDNFFLLPESPSIPPHQVRERVTLEFVRCLQSFTATCSMPIVWFFDHYEDASKEVVPWLHDEFAARVRDLEFGNLILVIAGREVPVFGMEWGHVVCAYDLGHLTVEDFEEYVNRTSVSMLRETVEWLYEAYDADIQKFALHIQAREQEVGP